MKPKLLLETLSASIVCGVVSVVFALADASILSGTELPEFFPVAVSIALISLTVLAAVVGVLSGMRFCIAGSQEITIVVLATMVVSVNSVMQVGGAAGEQERIATAIACLLSATVFVGCICALAGHYKLGRFIRYIPYPVIAGFLGGASLLLIKYAIEMSTGSALQWVPLPSLLTFSNFCKLLLACAMCGALFLLTTKISAGSTIIILMTVGLTLFYLFVFASGTTLESWILKDWTLIRSSEASVFPVLSFDDFSLVDWGVVAHHVPQMASLALITLITALVKISALESIARIDVDQDHELKALGAGNVAAGFAGGILGFHTLSISEMSRRMNAPTRYSGVGTALVCLVALIFSGDFLSYLPRFVFAGIIMWISVDLLIDFFIKPCQQLPKLDITILVAVVLSILFLGFLPAVVLGLVAATLIFVVEYSKITIVKSDYSGEGIRSNVDRDSEHSSYLNARGVDLKVYRLQGYMFFGTAYRLFEEIRTALSTHSPRYLILDFEKISGVDTSANLVISRILSYCHSQGIDLIVASAPDHTVKALQAGQRPPPPREDVASCQPQLHSFPNLDMALEWYEEKQLAKYGNTSDTNEPITLDKWLRSNTNISADLRISDFFTEQEVATNEILIQQGAPPEALYLVLSGRFNVTVAINNARDLRVRQVGPGSLLGEISVFTETRATASVVAAEPATVACIKQSDMQRMFNEHSQIAAVFHQKIASELATRLADSGRQIELFA